jgi:hypothetical protein
VGGGTHLIEFFSSPRANPNGYGEGLNFLGSATVSVNLLGNADLDATLPSPTDLSGQFFTATATDAGGITSEFSPAALIQTCSGVEQRVPNSKPSRVAGRRSNGSPSTGDGNGDGIPDWQESNVASLPSLPGLWVTLSALPGIVLENVTPTGPPDFASLPAGCVFPIGFLSFGITNLPVSGAVILTNFLHLDADAAFSYAAITYLNFGPTPDNPTPQIGSSCTCRMGSAAMAMGVSTGDRYRGGARLRSGPSATTVHRDCVGAFTNITDILPGTNTAPALVTNSTPIVSAVLSWPATTTNFVLQFLDDLSPPNPLDGVTSSLWQSLPGTPVTLLGQNYLTNTTLGPKGFYRLFPTR